MSGLVAIFIVVSFSLSYKLTYASDIAVSEVIKEVNESREKEGLEPLIQNEVLTKVAQDKLEDMAKNKYFAHTSPTGVTPWFWFEKNNYDYHFAGENLAINFLSAEEQHIAWMNSPTHRKNILNPDYQEIGVAFGAGEIDGQLSLITVQEFGTRIEAKGASKNNKIFSANDNGKVIKNENTIIPQVLSLKDDIAKNISSKDYFNSDKNTPAVLNYWTLISEIILLVALFMSPMVLIGRKIKKLFIHREDGEYVVGDYCEYKPNHNQEILGIKSG